jgi:hypothetical protein
VSSVCRYRVWSNKNGTSKAAKKAAKKGIPFLLPHKGRIVKVHPKSNLIGLQRVWQKYPETGKNDRCEFWVADADYLLEDDVEHRAKNLVWTEFFREMVEGEVGEEKLKEDEELEGGDGEEDGEEDGAAVEPSAVQGEPEVEVPVAAPAAKQTKASSKKAAATVEVAVEEPQLIQPKAVAVGDALFLVNPEHLEILAEVSITHVFTKGAVTTVPQTLIGGKVVLVEGYVGLTINKIRTELYPVFCKAFLAEFAFAGPNFNPLKDAYPERLTASPRAKLV